MVVAIDIEEPRTFTAKGKDFCIREVLLEEVPAFNEVEGAMDKMSFGWDPVKNDFTHDFRGLGMWKQFLRALGYDPDTMGPDVTRKQILGTGFMIYKEMVEVTDKATGRTTLKGPYLRRPHMIDDPKKRQEALEFYEERSASRPL
jgi:hypothetical protein